MVCACLLGAVFFWSLNQLLSTFANTIKYQFRFLYFIRMAHQFRPRFDISPQPPVCLPNSVCEQQSRDSQTLIGVRSLLGPRKISFLSQTSKRLIESQRGNGGRSEPCAPTLTGCGLMTRPTRCSSTSSDEQLCATLRRFLLSADHHRIGGGCPCDTPGVTVTPVSHDTGVM